MSVRKLLRRRNRIARFEPLEIRLPLAGNVTVDFIDGTLLITGDSADNAIELSDDGTSLVITGIVGETAADTTLSTNTAATVTIGGGGGTATVTKAALTGDLFAHLFDGDDEIFIDGLNSAGASLDVEVTINTGEGADLVEVGFNSSVELHDNLHIHAGAGDNLIRVNDLSIENSQLAGLFISAGNGGDTIQLGNATDVSVQGDISIRASGGDDFISADGVISSGNIHIDVGAGVDTVDIGRGDLLDSFESFVQASGDLIIQSGAGADTVNLDAVLIVTNIIINTSDGDDSVLIGDDPSGTGAANNRQGASARGDMVVTTGNGSDRVTINYSTGGNSLLVDLGLDADAPGQNTAILRNSSFSNDVAIIGGQSIDAIDIDALNIVTNLFISTNAGNDQLDIQGTLVSAGSLTINTGTGDDRTTVDNSIVLRLVLFAEAGNNTVNVTANLIDDFFLDLGPSGGSANLDGTSVRRRGFARGAANAQSSGSFFANETPGGSFQSEGFT